MAIGQGKYHAEAVQLLEQTGGRVVAVIVLEGSKGNGFSVLGPWEILERLPNILRHMADEIERDPIGE